VAQASACELKKQTQVCATIQQVNAVSRRRLPFGAQHGTTLAKSARRIAHCGASDGRNFQNKNSFSVFALANRNAKAGVNPGPSTD